LNKDYLLINIGRTVRIYHEISLPFCYFLGVPNNTVGGIYFICGAKVTYVVYQI